mmetsp:Transcript_12327/g.18931  ORF Transcript_12327/g.18931 Transcript_12327/m.18931 type:complete len:298 (-) Transcript_12327:16-909(-)
MRWVLLFAAAATAAAIDEAPKLRTRFTFRRPTGENILSILLGCDDLDQLPEKEVKFNHSSVGITRPILCNIPGESHHVFPLCSGFPLDNESKLNRFLDRFERSSSYTSDNIACSSISHNGWRLLRFHKRVGSGEQCYNQVQTAIYNWDFVSYEGKKSTGILAPKQSVHLANIKEAQSTIHPRRGLMGTFSEIPLLRPLFVVNPIHVICDMKNCRKKSNPSSIVSSSSYATLDGHLLAGEERVSVALSENNAVDVEIISFSRSAPSINGRIVWPFIGRMQKLFFLKEMEHLSRVAKCK